jgi:hypothetical protein
MPSPETPGQRQFRLFRLLTPQPTAAFRDRERPSRSLAISDFGRPVQGFAGSERVDQIQDLGIDHHTRPQGFIDKRSALAIFQQKRAAEHRP